MQQAQVNGLLLYLFLLWLAPLLNQVIPAYLDYSCLSFSNSAQGQDFVREEVLCHLLALRHTEPPTMSDTKQYSKSKTANLSHSSMVIIVSHSF